jgi:hypothetical protein|tara:strand:+ start:188 stop:1144 length:957 start_codon:yes stop_codon:yes gene_type:complete
MAEYKEIKGFRVQTRTEDPTEGIVGDFYYNSSTGQFKTIGTGVGAWSSGGNLTTARRYLAGLGAYTNALVFGGPSTGKTELYNGTSWTEKSDLNTNSLGCGRAGTPTSGLKFGGDPAVVEDWNGASWTSNPHSMNTARQFLASDGPSSDAAIGCGGEPPSSGLSITEVYDGSSWTEKGDLNTARYTNAGMGTVTAFLTAGGATPPQTTAVELFNGTGWTSTTAMNTARGALGGSGSSTLAVVFGGGNPTAVTNTESWDGTSWTEGNDIATARRFGGSSNITGNTSALFAGGKAPPPSSLDATEEWLVPDFVTKTVTTS